MLSTFASHTSGPVGSEVIINNEIGGFWVGIASLCMIGFALYRLIKKRCFNSELS